MRERTAVRCETRFTDTQQETLEKENDLHIFLDTYFAHARRARQHVEGTKQKERYLCAPRLGSLEEPNLQSHGCPRSMAWKHCCDSSRHKVPSCASGHGITSPGMLLEIRKKHEPMTSWSARCRNEYTKVRRALARLQRAETSDETRISRATATIRRTITTGT